MAPHLNSDNRNAMARIRLVECGEKGSLVKAGGLAAGKKRGWGLGG